MKFNLNDFENCFRTTHNGVPCNDRKCILKLTNDQFADLIRQTLDEGKKWEGTK